MQQVPKVPQVPQSALEGNTKPPKQSNPKKPGVSP